MHPLEELRKKEKRLIIGLMSGTSGDGIDAALVEISGFAESTKVRRVDFDSTPYSAEIRERILSVADGTPISAAEFCRLKALIGIIHGEACLNLCRRAGISPSQVDMIGFHGQTVWHIPKAEDYFGRHFASTLQIGEEAEIAEMVGCPVVGDFRVRDIACGGQGAPLVPYTEYLLYRSNEHCVALQNIGGIGNVTVMPAGCSLDQLTAFDTGPGNMVIDSLVRRMTGDKMHYDKDGLIALSAEYSPELLAWMLQDPYLKVKPPKTTGREVYGSAYIDAVMERASALGVTMEGAVATATRFTAECIARGLRDHAPQMPDRLIVCGGGAHNPAILKALAELLPGCEVIPGDDLGIPADEKEAVAFAILANEYLFASPSNAPAATGASKPVVLGKLSY